MTLRPPTIDDVHKARTRLAGLLPRTPLLRHPLLEQALGCEVWVKHENHLPTGAFKVRGGLNLIGEMVAAEGVRPVITASTGNHGQSIALACQRHQVPCTVVVPRGNNPDKNAAMRAFGADVVEVGADFDAAREEVERRVAAEGLRYVHSANEPLLIAGVGTYALEVFEELQDIDTVFVPIGGGSGASGLVTVRDGLQRKTTIVGVQAVEADAFTRSWRTGTRVTADRVNTFAEGVACRVTFDLPFGILQRGLHDIVTLSEEELEEGVRLALELTHNLAEGAGAAALMAAWKDRDRLRGRRVVCIMSGGNLTMPTLRKIVAGAREAQPA